MTIRTQRVNYTNKATALHEWAAVDTKGREIGLIVTTEELDLIEMTAETGCFMTLPAGHYFTANMQMTKNGNAWGACQSTQYFATVEERTAAIVKRLHAAMKKTGTL